MNFDDPIAFLHDLSAAAIAAADPLKIVPRFLPEKPKGRIFVIGAGKASAQMARAVEQAWPDEELHGLVVTRYGFGVPCERIKIVEAAHPVPDQAGVEGCRGILNLLKDATEDDLVLCLISGGGSALLSSPDSRLPLEERQAINNALLRSGAPIGAMNCVRKHLSNIKGGQLALAAHPARVVTLIISDVPGDDPTTVASGPTLPDPTTQAQALAIIDQYNIPVSDLVRDWLSDPANETPKPGDPRFDRCETHIISSARDALEAAERFAKEKGLECLTLGDDLEGESREVAIQQVKRALETRASAPVLLLSGGETTVTIKGQGGKGGRNTEYTLAAAIAANGNDALYGIAVDTDGIDGSEDNAGAYFTPETLSKAQQKHLDASAFLAGNDSYSFFQGIDGLVMTGPTYTNVNDFRALLVLPA